MVGIIIAIIATLVIAVPVSAYVANTRSKKAMEITIGNAEDKAREIIDEAIKAADAKKREASLEVKEETIKARHDFEKETKERRAELQKYEQRVLSKEETVEKKATVLERKEQSLTAKEKNIDTEKAQLQELQAKHLQELERISGLTSDQAKEQLLSAVKEDVKHETAMYVKEMETRAKEDARKKAKEYVVTAIQKCAVDHVAETTISLVQLPNDEMKGRIIGREGRNIRSIENATGVELIIDDTPEAVVLSSFNPVRREIARIALEKLIVDGRIHPARIEEMVEKATKEVETMMREEGEAATLELGVHGIHPELVRLLGRMKFRTSYGQNALKHSMEVAELSGLLAAEIGVDVRMAKRAGLLHDIGKSIDHEVEGSHVELGVNLCKKYKENPIVINAVASHHGDEEPESLIACLVQAADAISAARPGARSETLESYTTRLKQLEEIADSFQGVDKTFAIQAGREIRVMVVPEQISDDDMILLARDISNQIEENLDYPGQIKVNVIRESRVVDYAK
ncbi:ribonuclease Y [Anaerostipes hadrus]|uniref:ribonuclease Y n=1 Tax=Anaerostipes hadrus TaxID=649756 RepID=UPI0022DF5AFB|nr:ribonuclease Y [Anaerostipes hadrus]